MNNDQASSRITDTLDAHQLRELAKQMRHSCAPASMGITPDYLRQELTRAANLFDAVANGRGDPGKVQPAVDAVLAAFDRDRAEKAETAIERINTAINDDNAEAWRESTVEFLESLSGDDLRCVMQGFLIGLDHVAKESGYVDLENVEIGGLPC